MGVVAPERERERTDPEASAASPPAASFPWGGVLALVAVIVLIVGVRDWLPDLIPSIPNPFAETTIDRSRPAVLQSIRDLSEYHAAGGHYEVVVDIEKDTPLPSEVLGQRTLFIGVGDVDAVVDFGGIDSGAVTVSRNRRDATIVVPPPRVEQAAARPRARATSYDQQRGRPQRARRALLDDAGARARGLPRGRAPARRERRARQSGGLTARGSRTNDARHAPEPARRRSASEQVDRPLRGRELGTGARRARPRPPRRSRARRRSAARVNCRPPARLAHLDSRPGTRPCVVEPVQQVAVVLGEPDDRRARARARGRRAARARGSPPARTSVSTGQPCGQRSGLPSRSAIRSTMSSVNVSPSSSAWTCDSAAV